jgi:hypothetical protein
MSVKITRRVPKLHAKCQIQLVRASRNYTCESHNHTLPIKITLVRVEITDVSVAISFECVKVTLCVEITLCVWKLHSA